MKRITDFLKNSSVQYLASIGLDGKPKVRPFQFMFEDDGKLWFCTSNQKEVYKELMMQANIELCASGEKMSWLRIEGKAVFEDNVRIKEKVLEHSSLVKSIYKTASNIAFEVFYLDEATASISSIGKEVEVICL